MTAPWAISGSQHRTPIEVYTESRLPGYCLARVVRSRGRAPTSAICAFGDTAACVGKRNRTKVGNDARARGANDRVGSDVALQVDDSLSARS